MADHNIPPPNPDSPSPLLPPPPPAADASTFTAVPSRHSPPLQPYPNSSSRSLPTSPPPPTTTSTLPPPLPSPWRRHCLVLGLPSSRRSLNSISDAFVRPPPPNPKQDPVPKSPSLAVPSKSLETFNEVGRDAGNGEEINLFHWHLASLEYANAGLLSKLSLAFWDQDDPYDMGGDHCFLPGGNGRLMTALAENLPIQYEKTVHSIHYGNDGVRVFTGNQVFEGSMALCTVPLGVLKSDSIKFVPELPQRKLDSIRRLGFGLLNKVAMLFPHVFWGTDLDTFEHVW